MKILIIGGNGNISWWCAREALKRNHDVSIITRGLTWKTRREPIKKAKYIRMDINDLVSFKDLIAKFKFDVVCDFLNYDVQSTALRIEILKKSVSKYVMISSTIIYERNHFNLVLNEDSKLRKIGFSPYVDGKLKIEKLINSEKEIASRTLIIRPSHTFDTNVPTPLGSNCFTEINRVLNGGNLLVPEDGTKKWTLMHSEDFSKVWIELVERQSSFGQAFNVVNDINTTWNDIARQILLVLGVSTGRVKYVSTNAIESIEINSNNDLKNSNLGKNYVLHRKWNDIYDTSKLQAHLPNWSSTRTFSDGFTETINWLMEDPIRQRINPSLLKVLKNLDNQIVN